MKGSSWKAYIGALCILVGGLMAFSLTAKAAGHGEYTTAEERLADMEVVAEQDGLRLYLDREYGEFAVEKEAGEAVWFSNPYDSGLDGKSNEETKQLLQSLVRLTWFDESTDQFEMNSWKDCISKGQFDIETIEGGFRLNLEMGEKDEGMIVPHAAEASKFEEKVLALLEGRSKRKIESYYTRVSINDEKLSEKAMTGYLEGYPGLESNDFYILRGINDRERRDIAEIIGGTQYTLEDMEEDLALSGHEVEEAARVLINLSLEVTIDGGDLSVRIPGDSIQYDKTICTIGDITLLQYFGAAKSEEGGYLFLPDGSGALLSYNQEGKKKTLYTRKPVYGTDYAINTVWSQGSLVEDAQLPVYGNKTGDKAYLAIMETGEAQGTIVCESGNILTSYEAVYPVYSSSPSLTVNYMKNTTKLRGMYTFLVSKPYEGDYGLRFRFLTGEDADWMGMAKSYRSWLLEKGILSARLSETVGSANLYVETLGAVDKKESFLGFPYTTYAKLTTFDQAGEILRELTAGGVTGLKLRYSGWMNNGLYHEVSDHVDVLKALGGTRKLQQLLADAGEMGVEVFPEADFTTVRMDRMFDGYLSPRHSADRIEKMPLYLVSPGEITNLDEELQYSFYSVSPLYYSSFMKKFFRDYDRLGIDSVSLGGLGAMLYGDYDRKKPVNREAAKGLVVEAIQENADVSRLMTEGGNAYLFPFVTDIVGIPMGSSSYTNEDEDVPFMQMVLHGSVHYASGALNLTADPEGGFLKCIEYGVSPSFTVVYDNYQELKNTVYDLYCSVDYQTWKDRILEYGKAFGEAYGDLAACAMVNHEKLQEGVYRTTYEGGVSFFVNYNEEAVQVDGRTIPARGYLKAAD